MQTFPDIGNLVSAHREQAAGAGEVGHDVMRADVAGIAVHPGLPGKGGHGVRIQADTELQGDKQGCANTKLLHTGQHGMAPIVRYGGDSLHGDTATSFVVRVSSLLASAAGTTSSCSTVFR